MLVVTPTACQINILNCELEEKFYVEQPQRFVKRNEEEGNYKLKNALYGLKEAPTTWYRNIDDLILLWKQWKLRREFNKDMMKKYEISERDPWKHFIGMEITQIKMGLVLKKIALEKL